MSSLRGSAYFTTSAQISLGIVGITGLVAVLRHEAAWSPGELMGLRLILENAGAGVLLSMVAVLLGAWGLSKRRAWTIASLALAVFLAAELLLQGSRWIHSGGPRHPRLLALSFFLPVSALLAAQIMNVCRWRSFGPFALGILWLVFAAGFQTALLILRATEIHVP